MSEFQFAKSQRVIVPADKAGAENVQGVITVNVARLGREPHYEVQWPCCDAVNDKGDLKMLCTDVSESELIKAQPDLIPAAEVRDLIATAHKLAADAEARLHAVLLDRRRKRDRKARKASKRR